MRWTQRIGQVAKSPPDQTKRPVGTYDVTPTEGGVHVGGSDRVAVLNRSRTTQGPRS